MLGQSHNKCNQLVLRADNEHNVVCLKLRKQKKKQIGGKFTNLLSVTLSKNLRNRILITKQLKREVFAEFLHFCLGSENQAHSDDTQYHNINLL